MQRALWHCFERPLESGDELPDRCIASLLGSGYPDVEVIVVDDASTDGTRERLVELEREHQQLRLLLLPESVKKKRALVQGLKPMVSLPSR